MFFVRITEWDWSDAPTRVPIFFGDVPRRTEPLPRFLDDGDFARFMRALAAEPRLQRRVAIKLLFRWFLQLQGADYSDLGQALRDGRLDELPVTEGERLLLEYVGTVTRHAHRVTDDQVGELRRAGWGDEQIAETTCVTALFNPFLRLADAFRHPPRHHDGSLRAFLERSRTGRPRRRAPRGDGRARFGGPTMTSNWALAIIERSPESTRHRSTPL